MITVRVVAIGAVRTWLGWQAKDFELTGGCVSDVLKTVRTKDGDTLYDRIVDDQIRSGFAVRLNGQDVSSTGLETPLKDKDVLVVMELVPITAGG